MSGTTNNPIYEHSSCFRESDSPFVPLVRHAFSDSYRCSSFEEAVTLACARLREEAGERTPPYSLSRLLAICNAKKSERPIATDGKLELQKSGYLITVNSRAAWRRQRFTIAHEIGHILLIEALASRPSDLKMLKAPAAWKAVERICDLLAAELLMPCLDFVATLTSTGFSQRSLSALYDRYMTSYSSLFVRFKQLYPTASIALWRRCVRPTDSPDVFRVTRCYRGSDGPWLPKGISSRYLDPDIIRYVDEGQRGRRVRVLVQGLDKDAVGVAVLAPAFRDGAVAQPPLFNGFVVPDERAPGFDVALLLVAGDEGQRLQLFRTVEPDR